MVEGYSSEEKVVAELRRQVQTYETQKALAEALGYSPQFLSDVLRQRRGIPDALATKLGYRRVVLFERRRGGEERGGTIVADGRRQSTETDAPVLHVCVAWCRRCERRTRWLRPDDEAHYTCERCGGQDPLLAGGAGPTNEATPAASTP